jgi:hypothetical protein
LERLANRSRSFRLAPEARARLKPRLDYAPRASIDEHWDVVRAYLDGHAEIGRDDVVALLRLKPARATQLLSAFYNERGLIEPVGNPRGRGVRYRLARR